MQNIVDDHALPEPAMYVLSLLYAVMIAGSVIGNVLVITAVLKSPSMRKVRLKKETGYGGYRTPPSLIGC